MKIEVKKSWMSATALLVLAAAAIGYLAVQFLSMREVEPIYPGPGVTERSEEHTSELQSLSC